jgi:hypothetical protein
MGSQAGHALERDGGLLRGQEESLASDVVAALGSRL